MGGVERYMVNVCLKMFAAAKALSQLDMDKKKDQSMCRGGTRDTPLPLQPWSGLTALTARNKVKNRTSKTE